VVSQLCGTLSQWHCLWSSTSATFDPTVSQHLAALEAFNAIQKIAKSDLNYQLIVEENFWLVAPPSSLLPINLAIITRSLTTLDLTLLLKPTTAITTITPNITIPKVLLILFSMYLWLPVNTGKA
jgi:hypothetical protein